MNDTSATTQPGTSLLPAGTGAITAVHLVLILLIAGAAIAIIVAGMRRKRIRDQAARDVDRHAEEAGVPLAAPEPEDPAPAPAPPTSAPMPAPTAAPMPVAPSPSPMADEPIAAGPLGAGPAALAADTPTGAAPASADAPITTLKGLGPKVAARLAELGVTTVGQLAALDNDRAAALDARLGTFSGRMARDRWIEQARFLAAGDRAGFEAVFGRLS